MRNLILFFLFITISEASICQVTVSELNLKGAVKSISEISFEALQVKKKVKKGGKKREVEGDYDFYILFSENGNKQLELLSLSNKEGIHYKRELIYNQEGYLKERKWFDANGVIANHWIYTLDDFGNSIEVINTAMNNPKAIKKSYEYNNNGNILDYKTFKQDNSLNIHESYSYDTKGNLIEEIKYKPDGNIKMKLVYKYDENGNKITFEKHFNNQILFGTFFYKYDDAGNIIEEIRKDLNGELDYKWDINYNKKGLIIEKKVYKTPSLILEKIITFKYKYDSKRNWIQKIKFQDGEPIYIFERRIEYF